MYEVTRSQEELIAISGSATNLLLDFGHVSVSPLFPLLYFACLNCSDEKVDEEALWGATDVSHCVCGHCFSHERLS